MIQFFTCPWMLSSDIFKMRTKADDYEMSLDTCRWRNSNMILLPSSTVCMKLFWHHYIKGRILLLHASVYIFTCSMMTVRILESEFPFILHSVWSYISTDYHIWFKWEFALLMLMNWVFPERRKGGIWSLGKTTQMSMRFTHVLI
jgi:hypothetical protein